MLMCFISTISTFSTCKCFPVFCFWEALSRKVPRKAQNMKVRTFGFFFSFEMKTGRYFGWLRKF